MPRAAGLCSARAVFWAVALVLLPERASAEGLAVLRLEPAGDEFENDGSVKADAEHAPGQGKSFPALFAEWSANDSEVSDLQLVHPAVDPYGCRRLRKCKGCALVVLQGNCSFAQKARRAEGAGAELLIVTTAEEGPAVKMAASQGRRIFGPSAPRITAVSVSQKTGRYVLEALDRGQDILASCKRHDALFGDIASEVVVAALAVGLVVFGAWHSVEDLRHPETKHRFNEECLAVEESSGFQFVLFGSLMLTVLFFFMKYLIYVLLLLFASGAISTTTMLIEPVIAGWNPLLRARKAYSLPKRLAGWLGLAEDHTRADLLAEIAGFALAGSFLLYRNNDAFGWLLQDSIAVMLLLTIQRTLRLPNLKVGTLLLVCTFFFDIFWVFLSPLIFKKSVMIEVATGGGTGQSVPMVLKIPALAGDLPGQFKILGLGDVAIPGLLISLLLRHDLVTQTKCLRGYFTAGVIGYALGLLATFISLYLMKHGQPALLFLVPGTLLPTCLIACRKGELGALWSASYGPEQPPEGYDQLGDGEGKSA